MLKGKAFPLIPLRWRMFARESLSGLLPPSCDLNFYSHNLEQLTGSLNKLASLIIHEPQHKGWGVGAAKEEHGRGDAKSGDFPLSEGLLLDQAA